ncbi:MAG: citramalate synthase [Nitrospirota bacterium]
MKKIRTIEIYDTTLRDGAQSEDMSFSVEDKLRISKKLDTLGVHYIEGGWPGANPKDLLFFKEAKKLELKKAQMVAFGSTRKARHKVSEDPTLQSLLHAGTEIVTLFGKSWNLHVKDVLGISPKKNLELISDSIAYLHSKGKRVFFDAEHFFDGFSSDPDYAISVLLTAKKAGAETLILCDTNGGTMPWQVYEVVKKVKEAVDTPLGIHTHNDSEVAVANALMAVSAGVCQVQGTINGFGERCGNANLTSIIANLKLKMNIKCIADSALKQLADVSRFVSEVANLSPNKYQPYVGTAAFAHKGGVHVDAVRKNAATYEHVAPESVGNKRRILISDYSGRGNLLEKAAEYQIPLAADHPDLHGILHRLKEMEGEGYQFEGAEGSLELMMKKKIGVYRRFFQLAGFRVTVEKGHEGDATSEATVMVDVNGQIQHATASGNGPVNALDKALRKALQKFYPALSKTLSCMSLLDYKVRVLAAQEGSNSKVRVLCVSGDGKKKWGTVGVSENIIEASWQALVDSIECKLLRDPPTGGCE